METTRSTETSVITYRRAQQHYKEDCGARGAPSDFSCQFYTDYHSPYYKFGDGKTVLRLI